MNKDHTATLLDGSILAKNWRPKTLAPLAHPQRLTFDMYQRVIKRGRRVDSQLFNHLLISGGMMAATTLVHAVFVASSAAIFRASNRRAHGPMRFFRDVGVLVALGVWLLVAHFIEMGIWAWLFLHLDLFAALEPALYFSAASYTTLGFGDVLLPEEWRLLSGACAASGLLMFGLSAAFLFETTGKLDLSGEE